MLHTWMTHPIVDWGRELRFPHSVAHSDDLPTPESPNRTILLELFMLNIPSQCPYPILQKTVEMSHSSINTK